MNPLQSVSETHTMDQDFSVSVRIRHPAADPAELTKHLGLQPQHFWKAGDRRPTTPDSMSIGTYRETYWLAQLPLPQVEALAELASSLSLESTLALAMHQFDRCPSFWRQFIAEGGSAEFLVEVFGGDGFTLELSHATVSKMARLGMAISVSVHPELQAVA
jgi:hypothetical protein